MTDTPKITEAITRANDMALGASFLIMETSGSAQKQARFFQSLFASVRDVLQEAVDSEPSPAACRLADAVLDGGETR